MKDWELYLALNDPNDPIHYVIDAAMEKKTMPTKETIFIDKCGYKWAAPLVHPDYTVTSVPQVCDEPKDHEGDHRSSGKVTAPNKKGN